MTDPREATPDRGRTTLRMTPEQQDLLRRAAEVLGMPLSAFVLTTACQAAEKLSVQEMAKAATSDVESLWTFTKPARQRWVSIPADIRQRMLSNVWCGHCGHEVTITGFSGTITGPDLLLVGRCAECQGEVARSIEGA